MTTYEVSSLAATIVYDILTLLLLTVVAFEAFIKTKLPDFSVSLRLMPKDTESAGWKAQLVDMVFENHGGDAQNVLVKSAPDDIGWGNIDLNNQKSKKTSEYFSFNIPRIPKGSAIDFFWCEMQANADVVSQPVQITLEYDNPIFFWPRRWSTTVDLNLIAYKDRIWPMTSRYDIHNVAEELSRIRQALKTTAR